MQASRGKKKVKLPKGSKVITRGRGDNKRAYLLIPLKKVFKRVAVRR
jgi:hypothetical protein